MKNLDLLLKLYTDMVRIRACEESLVDPIEKGEIKTPCHLYTGQEAVAAGVCAALKKTDAIFGGHRSHGHYLAKGGDMNGLVAEIFAKSGGCSGGRGGSMHIISPENGVWGVVPIVAGTISLATGAAMAAKIQKKDQVIISFFGDGATGEGVLYESLNLASLLQLPIIYVCENNFYSTHMPLRECRRRDNIFQTGVPFGIRGVRVDGNDVLSVFKESQKAVALCRAGKGPIFLECVTYRMRGHVGADDNVQGSHTDIRPASELERWRRRDPLSRFEKVLSKAGVKKETLHRIQKGSSEEVARAHAFAHASPAPAPRDLGLNVFDAEGFPCPL